MNCSLCAEILKEGEGQMETFEYGRVHFKCWETAD